MLFYLLFLILIILPFYHCFYHKHPKLAYQYNYNKLNPIYTRNQIQDSSKDKIDSPLIPIQSNISSNDLTLDFSQLQPFLKIAIPFFKEDEIARNSLLSVSITYKSDITISYIEYL